MSDSDLLPPDNFEPGQQTEVPLNQADFVKLGNAQELVEVVRQLRQEAGYSQQVVAEKIGISQKTMSSLERHIDRANFTRIYEVLNLLDADIYIRKR